MARRLRYFDSTCIYFITVKTFQGRLLLPPDPVVTEIIGGALARAQQLYDVEVFAFVALNNHVHLLCRSRDGRLAAFMQFVLSNVAKKVGRYVSWEGGLWSGKGYASEPVLDSAALEERLRYILKHGVKEGLVDSCRDWPGLSCLPQLLGDLTREFRWFHWTRRWKCGRARPGAEHLFSREWAESLKLTLSPLPHWANDSAEERRARIAAIIDEIDMHAGPGPSRLGIHRLLRQHPHTRVRQKPRTREPLCHGSEAELRHAMRRAYQDYAALYRAASERFRGGEHATEFPANSFRPYVRPWEVRLPEAAAA